MNLNIQDIIIFEDRQLIVCNKSATIPTQPDKSGDTDILTAVTEYCQCPVHMISRLDRPVSGLVVLIKEVDYFNDLRKIWNSEAVTKEYIAVCEGMWNKENGLLENRLIKGTNHKARLSEKGKSAILQFQCLARLDHYSVLLVRPLTGRFHQIRAQLAHAGHPVKGDVKYGARRKNPDRSIHLHCYRISIPEKPEFIAPLNHWDRLWSLCTPMLIK